MRCAVGLVATLWCLSCGCAPPGGNPTIPVPGGLQPAGTPVTSDVPTGIGGLKKVESPAMTATKKKDEYWNQEEVENWVRQDLKLAKVTLTAKAGHEFAGTGLSFNGRNYTLTIKQIPGGIKCWFSDDFGGSGNMAFGKMADEPKPFVPK